MTRDRHSIATISAVAIMLCTTIGWSQSSNTYITTVAGIGAPGYSGDNGAATSAALSSPRGVAVDANGNLYIADPGNNRVRKVGANGIITTVAGNGTAGFQGDGGAATSAELFTPWAVAVDSLGNLYISDLNNSRVRKVTPGGIISTFAGNDNHGYSGDNVQATTTSLFFPQGLAVDSSNNVYIADTNNYRVRMVTPGGIITTVAGTGVPGFAGDGGAATSAGFDSPLGVAVDSSGNIYVSDYDGSQTRASRVRKISGGIINTVVGNGSCSYTGDGGAGTSATLCQPSGLAISATGFLYIADGGNNVIRQLTPSGVITTVAGGGSGCPQQLNAIGDGCPGTSASLFSPSGVAVDPFNRLFIADTGSQTSHSVIRLVLSLQALRFVPVVPCRVADTRGANGPFGGPIMAGTSTRDFTIPSSACNIPANALAYSLNVTVVPPAAPLGFLAIWPTGQAQPSVSTLNSLDGRIKANSAIVPAGLNGAVRVYVSGTTHVVLDINGYFVPANGNNDLAFYPVTPCRLADTRGAAGTFGGPALVANGQRNFPVAGNCGIPGNAQAYALNMTVVPTSSLSFLAAWPTGAPQPGSSTLNALTGAITSNMAILPAGTGGAITVLGTDQTHLIIDVNGYFAPPAPGSLDFYTIPPCRLLDTRNPTGTFGGPIMGATETRSFPLPSAGCNLPSAAKAFSLNATVVPPAPLGFLSLWGGGAQPLVSTLNSLDAAIVSNAALVPAGTNGLLTAYTSGTSHLIMDINGFFQ